MFEKLFKTYTKGLTGSKLVSTVCRMLADHSHKGTCKNATHLVQNFGTGGGNSGTTRNALNASITSKRKKCEKIDAEAEDCLSIWLKQST